MSREFQSRPATSFERALHLIEHVAQHRSAKFIRDSSKNIKLNNKNIIYKFFFQFYFDFWVVGAIFVFVIFKIFIFTLKVQSQLISYVSIL